MLAAYYQRFQLCNTLGCFWTRHVPSKSNCCLPFSDALGRRRGCPTSLKQCLRRQCATNPARIEHWRGLEFWTAHQCVFLVSKINYNAEAFHVGHPYQKSSILLACVCTTGNILSCPSGQGRRTLPFAFPNLLMRDSSWTSLASFHISTCRPWLAIMLFVWPHSIGSMNARPRKDS